MKIPRATLFVRKQQISSSTAPFVSLRKAVLTSRLHRRATTTPRMLSSVEIITTPTSDTPGSALVLDFPDRQYLIGNIHEGLQRALLERGVRLSRVTDIFITGRTEWKSIGGLLGTVLSAADVRATAAAASAAEAEEKLARLRERRTTGERQAPDHKKKSRSNTSVNHSTEGQDGGIVDESASRLTIHGGVNLTHSIAATRKFIFRRGMPLRINEFQKSGQRSDFDREWKPDWVDERVRVWSMAIAPTEDGERGSLVRSESPLKRRHEVFMESESNAMMESESTTIMESESNANMEIDTAPNLASTDSHVEDQRVRALTVAHMFDSVWHPDQLEEVSLAAVPWTLNIFIRDQATQEIRPYTGPRPNEMNPVPVPSIKVLIRKPWPAAQIKQLPSTKISKVAMSYIFRNHTQRGRFQPKKAMELKVPPGPLWGKLAEGESVQSTDGQTIHPDMVLLDSRAGTGFAVVDLPSPEYVRNLVERQEWQAPAVMNGVEMIVWILGPGVGENEQLLDFMGQHGNLKHIISSQDYCPNYISFDSSASGTIQLNQINPVQYPLPVHDNAPLIPMGQSKLGQNVNLELIQAQRGIKLILTPSVYFRNKIIPPLDTEGVLRSTPSDVLELAREARATIDLKSCEKESPRQNIPSPDAEIVFLGTGSALPSKYRNVSSTLLRVPGSGSYLLDCGENTMGQLRRIYRPKQLSELLRDLKLIWISHLHADHHLGLPSVIKAWYEEVYGERAENPQEPTSPSATHAAEAAQRILDKASLIIVSNSEMHEYLREYSEVEDIGLLHLTRLICGGGTKEKPCTVFYHPGQDTDPQKLPEVLKTAGISYLQSCYVQHCLGAQAVSITFPTGFKFSYSGDCRPSKLFAQIGKDSTVLLHEATFDDELRADAKKKKHSTTSEAIGVGVAMGARRVLLTHFSQRYQKLPIMSDIKGLDVKLEGDTDAGDEIDGAGPNVELAAGGSSEPDTSIISSLPSANCALSTSDTSSTLPQTLPEVNSVSVNEALPLDLKIGVAFDLMRVKVGDIIHLEKFTPALLKLYEEQKGGGEAGLHKEDRDDNNDEMGEAPVGPNKPKLKPKAKKKVEKIMENQSRRKAEKRTKENSTNETERQAASEINIDDKQAVPKPTEAAGSTKPLPSSLGNIDAVIDANSGKTPKQHQAISPG